MKWYRDMRIGGKLILGFVIVAIIAGVIGIVGVTNIKKVDDADTYLYEQMTVPLGEMVMITESFQRMRGNVKDVILSIGDNTKIDGYHEDIKARNVTFDENLNSFKSTLITDEAKDLVDDLIENKAAYDDLVEDIIELSKEGKRDEALAINSGEGNQIRKEIQKGIEALKESKIDNAAQTAKDNTDLTKSASTIMITLIVVGVGLSIGLGLYIANVIKKPLNKMLAAADKISDGDLDVHIDIQSKDEVGQLGLAFKKMTDNLNSVMSNINSASDQVAAGSSQVSDSSMSLSQGATEQASSIEELTASVEEIASQTRQNAANADKAKEQATDAKGHAERGNAQMSDMLQSMEEINQSSSNISKIIKVIDDIAFQTNILALNAAVEAARAGQHGKGFAVVAEEVRNLAARSANAAKETTSLIEGSIEKVTEGTRIANETADALTRIVEGVSLATDLVAEIAVASNEQALGVEQINQGLTQISNVVQTTSATAEETAAASEELSGQSAMLKSQVATFKLRGYVDNQTEQVNPDVMKMLDSMQTQRPQESQSKVKKISLSDSEFDKY